MQHLKAMEAVYGNTCPLCLKIRDRRLHIDHHHGNGTVRGMVCSGCNSKLSVFDNEAMLERFTLYLKGGLPQQEAVRTKIASA